MRSITKFLVYILCFYTTACTAQISIDSNLREAIKARGLHVDSFIYLSNIDSLLNSNIEEHIPDQKLCYFNTSTPNWTYIIYTGSDSIARNGDTTTYINTNTSISLFRNDSSLLIAFPYSSNYFLGNSPYPMSKLLTYPQVSHHLYVFKHGKLLADIILAQSTRIHKFNDELHIKIEGKRRPITIPKEVFSYFKSMQTFNSDKFLQDFEMFFTLYKSNLVE